MKTFWAGAAAGWVIIGFAIAGVLRESERTHPVDFAQWFLGVAIGHDLAFAPLVLVAGVALARLVPRTVRPAVTAGLCVAGVMIIYSIPFLAGEGRRPANPSALPLNYWTGLGLIVAGIALVTALVAVLRHRRGADQTRRLTPRRG